MHNYTFLTDFRGGTYICQKAAEDLRSACVLWMEEIASGGYVPHLNVEAFTKAFHADIDELPPVPLDDLRNVWVFHLLLGKEMVDLHVVLTDVLGVGVGGIRGAVRGADYFRNFLHLFLCKTEESLPKSLSRLAEFEWRYCKFVLN